jgi:hypothetical protein
MMTQKHYWMHQLKIQLLMILLAPLNNAREQKDKTDTLHDWIISESYHDLFVELGLKLR